MVKPPHVVPSTACAFKVALNCWTWWEIFASCNVVYVKAENPATWRGSYSKEQALFTRIWPSQQVAMLVKDFCS